MPIPRNQRHWFWKMRRAPAYAFNMLASVSTKWILVLSCMLIVNTPRISDQVSLKQELSMPVLGRHIPSKKYNACLAELTRWMDAAQTAQTPCVLFGPLSQAWKCSDVESFSSKAQWRRTYHRLCHFDIKIDQAQTVPSSACFVALSFGVRMVSHSCKCAATPQEHRMDWTVKGLGVEREFICNISQPS